MICSEFQKGRLKDMFCLFQDEESNTKVNFQSHIISRFAWSFCVFFKQKNAFQKTQLPWIHVVALTLQVSHIGLLTTPRRHWHVCPTAKKISLPDHPLFVIVDENLHIFGEFAWTIWGLLFGSQAQLRYQKNTTELHPHIHMTCADSLVVTYSRIFHLDPWMTRKPS